MNYLSLSINSSSDQNKCLVLKWWQIIKPLNWIIWVLNIGKPFRYKLMKRLLEVSIRSWYEKYRKLILQSWTLRLATRVSYNLSRYLLRVIVVAFIVETSAVERVELNSYLRPWNENLTVCSNESFRMFR